MINYKEAIITQNEDSTYRLELVGVPFVDKGREFEANLIFPNVSKRIVDLANNGTLYDFSQFNPLPASGDGDILTLCIPE